MINTIILDQISTYRGKSVKIQNLGTVNFFYGLNGSGKSTIAKVMRNGDLAHYPSCRLEYGMNCNYPTHIHVYNDDFVKENFSEATDQPSIFSLGKDNIDAEREILQSKNVIHQIDAQIENITQEKAEIEGYVKAAREAFIDTLFTIKQNHDKQKLDFCLSGAKKREGMWQKFIETDYQESTDTFQLLEEKAKQIDSSVEPKEQLTHLSIDSQQIQTNEINSLWTTLIAPTGESTLKELIDQLSNSKWVETGKLYLTASNQCCPFCQQKLPEHFLLELERMFNESYKKQIEELDSLKQNYAKYRSIVHKSWQDNQRTINELDIKNKLTQAYNTLITLINTNILLIESKTKDPKTITPLTLTREALDDYLDNINSAQIEIEIFNTNINNKSHVKNDITKRFWTLIRYTHQTRYNEYLRINKQYFNKIESITNNLKNQISERDNQRNKYEIAFSKISNTEQAVNNINKLLREFGLSGFSLKQSFDKPPKYKIVRETNELDTPVYKSLSEGEKTIISFLYFLETCTGSESENESSDLKSRIIVIDDPISSLSHNHLYDIASLIVSKILENKSFGQAFILTHSLYFLNEFLMQIKEKKRRDWKFFHVKKYNNISTVEEFSHKEIQNTYQAYWHILKDASRNKITHTVIPNTMRNILEYYFSFVKPQKKLKSILQELSTSDTENISFWRFLNRESHRDAINIDEFLNYDTDRFLKCFEKIFKVSQFYDHYQAMMGLSTEED